MNDEFNTEENNFSESKNETQASYCFVCKNNPCICSNKGEDSASETPEESLGSDEKSAQIKRPKISWI